MDLTQIYILVSLVVLLIAIILMVFMKKSRNDKLTPLVGVAFVLMVFGIFFGNRREIIGYSLMGVGVLIALIDIFLKIKKV